MKRIKKDAVFLIDGSAMLYRSYYGIHPLKNSQGIPCQAIFGFARSMKKLIDTLHPQHLLLIWDSKGKTFRNDIYEKYKATRQAPPSDLFEQKEYIVKFADLIGLKQIAKSGFEADDLIYALAHDVKNKQVVILGPDKDLQQLISDNVIVFDITKDEIIDTNTFKEKRGFEPKKLGFYHALVGDSSDNIPGVKGIGKQGATKLVKQFDSLDDMYKNLNTIKKIPLKNKLESDRNNAFLSFKLFSLKYTNPGVSINDMHFDEHNWINALPLFEELEFKGLASGIRGKITTQPKPQKESGPEKQMSIFQVKNESELKLTEKHKSKKAPWTSTIIHTGEQLYDLIKKIKAKKHFAFDTETMGVKPLSHDLVGCSIALDTKEAFYIPVAHTDTEISQLNRNEVLKILQPILADKRITKVLQNAKFDELVLYRYKTPLVGIEFDTLLAANLLRKEDEKIGLKKLSVRYLGEPMDDFKQVMGKKKKTFAEVPIKEAAEYGAHDALQTLKLESILKKDLNKEPILKKIFRNVEMPLSEILFDMERTGVMLDTEKLKHVNTNVSSSLKQIENKITAAIDHKRIGAGGINLNSPKQVERLLFKDLKLPTMKRTPKGTHSTDHEVLLQLSKQHPVPGLILKYRELFKLKSTYLDTLPNDINPETKRIHSSWNQTLVATGRLSSSEPNLQNIPTGEGYGIQIRSAFIAPRGKQLISADYSQIDLRVLAHLSKDKNLTKAFIENKDIHTQTAAQIFDVLENKITSNQRKVGKRINFSIIYGLTAYGLSKDLDIPRSEAKEYIEKYFEQYPKVASWLETIVEHGKKDGFVTTWMGKRRYIKGLNEKNKSLFEAAKRVATNFPVQGTSAELMKLAMINISKALHYKKLESKIILQIHDELVLECPANEVKTVESLLEKEMTSVVKWEIPLQISMKSGKNWGEITK